MLAFLYFLIASTLFLAVLRMACGRSVVEHLSTAPQVDTGRWGFASF
jgi:hypothetical protein